MDDELDPFDVGADTVEPLPRAEDPPVVEPELPPPPSVPELVPRKPGDVEIGKAMLARFTASTGLSDPAENVNAWIDFVAPFLFEARMFTLPNTKKLRAAEVLWIPGRKFDAAGSNGPTQADIAIVTKAPDANAEMRGSHILSDSTEYLRSELGKVGVNLAECYYTTACKYRMPNRAIDKVPSAWMAESTWVVQQELRLVKPKYILVCGADAMKALFGRDAKISNSANTVLEWNGSKVVVAPNPADVLRNTERLADFSRAVAFFGRVVSGQDEAVQQLDYRYVSTLSELKKNVDELMQYDWFSMDCEWEGKTYTEGSLMTVQLSWAKGCALNVILNLPVDGTRFFPHPTAAHQELRRLLCRPNVKIIGHNFRADAKWVTDLGLDLIEQYTNGFDTILASHLLCETDEHNLTSCSLRDTDIGRYDKEMQDWLDAGGKHHTAPRNIILPYGCGDADATYRLFVTYASRLWAMHCAECQKRGVDPVAAQASPNSPWAREHGYVPTEWNLLKHIVVPVGAAINEMEMEGLPVDVGRMVEMVEMFDKKRQELLSQIRTVAMDQNLNPDSSDQLKQFLYGAPDFVDPVTGQAKYCLGLTPVKTTGKRGMYWNEVIERGLAQYKDGIGWESEMYAPSTDAESLSILYEGTPEQEPSNEAGLVRDYKFISQICKCFLCREEEDPLTGELDYKKGLLGLMHADKRIRTIIQQLTETGRWRSSKPNMQNLRLEVVKPFELLGSLGWGSDNVAGNGRRDRQECLHRCRLSAGNPRDPRNLQRPAERRRTPGLRGSKRRGAQAYDMVRSYGRP